MSKLTLLTISLFSYLLSLAQNDQTELFRQIDQLIKIEKGTIVDRRRLTAETKPVTSYHVSSLFSEKAVSISTTYSENSTHYYWVDSFANIDWTMLHEIKFQGNTAGLSADSSFVEWALLFRKPFAHYHFGNQSSFANRTKETKEMVLRAPQSKSKDLELALTKLMRAMQSEFNKKYGEIPPFKPEGKTVPEITNIESITVDDLKQLAKYSGKPVILSFGAFYGNAWTNFLLSITPLVHAYKSKAQFYFILLDNRISSSLLSARRLARDTYFDQSFYRYFKTSPTASDYQSIFKDWDGDSYPYTVVITSSGITPISDYMELNRQLIDSIDR